MVGFSGRRAAVATLLTLAAVVRPNSASVVDLLAAADWPQQDTSGFRRELLALTAANVSYAHQQTVGFGDVRHSVPLPPVVAGSQLAGSQMADSHAPQFQELSTASNSRVAAAPKLPNQLTICSNGIRICSGTNTVKLHGINWFGFETGATFVDGLYQGPSSLTLDFLTVLRRIKLLGFNTIRLPMSLKSLFEDYPRDYSSNCPYSGSNAVSATVWGSVRKPGLSTKAPSVTLPYTPAGALPLNGAAGRCNNYVPNSSTLTRFLWTVGVLARNGFIVVIDQHLNTDQTLVNNPTLWLQRWIKIVNEINKDPYSRRRVIFDILNEPDSVGLRWEAVPPRPGMTNTYLRFMNAAYKINPAFLYAIEGLGQGSLGTNWGDGLTTNQQVLQFSGASDPNPFFQALLKAPYRKKVIMMPHVYPPSISTVTRSDLANTPGYYTRLSNSFGYLNKVGYCYNGACQKFPVVLGEFGSRMRDCRNRCAAAGCMGLELSQMNALIKYLNNVGDAKDGKHESIDGWIWWSWNANSGDTGGLVEDDWASIIWQKISYLGNIGLRPWYSKYCGSSCFSALPTSSPSTCAVASRCSAGQGCANGYACLGSSCCPKTYTCGSKCCPTGQPCVGGTCCPIARQCSGKCCKAGQSCYRGRCIANTSLKKCGPSTCLKSVACNGRTCCGATKSCGKGRNTTCCPGTGICQYFPLKKVVGCCNPARACGKYCCTGRQKCSRGACIGKP